MCVSPPFGETELNTDNLHKYFKNKSYEDKIKVIKDITDTYKRTITFYFHYASKLHLVPDVSEAIKEYVAMGLNQSTDPDKKERIERFERAKCELEKYFKPEKTELFLEDYDEDEYLSIINDWIPQDTDLKWKKDSNKVKSIPRQDLALILFAIERMNETNEMISTVMKNSFSYQRCQSVLRKFGRGAHKNKIPRVFKVLKETGIIYKADTYIPEIRGNCYVSTRLFGVTPGSPKPQERQWVIEENEDYAQFIAEHLN